MIMRCLICHKNIESDLKIISIGEVHGKCWYEVESVQNEVSSYVTHHHKVNAILFNRNTESDVIKFIEQVGKGWVIHKDSSFYMLHLWKDGDFKNSSKVLDEGNFLVWNGIEFVILTPENFYLTYKKD